MLASNNSLTWMMVGYFNTVATQEEKYGSNPINSNNVDEFNTMISSLGLSDA